MTYRDLEQIADGYARRPGVSIEPRGLIHELYLRLVRAQPRSSATARAGMKPDRRLSLGRGIVTA